MGGFDGATPPAMLIITAVDATAHSATGNRHSSEAMQRGRVAALLQERLVQKFSVGRGTVISAPAGAASPNHFGRTLLLRCSLTQITEGNQALRLVLGFGAGRTTLRVTTDLLEVRGPSTVELATFNTRSTTGFMPGPGLGLASAAASGQLLGLAGGSAGLLLGMRETLNREIEQSSTKIASNLNDYFQDQEWAAFTAPVHSALGSYVVLPPPVSLQSGTSFHS